MIKVCCILGSLSLVGGHVTLNSSGVGSQWLSKGGIGHYKVEDRRRRMCEDGYEKGNDRMRMRILGGEE